MSDKGKDTSLWIQDGEEWSEIDKASGVEINLPHREVDWERYTDDLKREEVSFDLVYVPHGQMKNLDIRISASNSMVNALEIACEDQIPVWVDFPDHGVSLQVMVKSLSEDRSRMRCDALDIRFLEGEDV